MTNKEENTKKDVEPAFAKASARQGKSPTALREEEVLAFWKKEDIFQKSLEKEAPNGEFVFYDGPPFATGLPHWGSLLSSVSKDVVGRYKTMRGYNVPRRWGWDCHGLPIENMIEKKLGLKTKKDIEELGIDRFNEEARSEVLRFADDWKTYVDRVGRWVDFDNSYKTLDNTYVESVWWALKKINDDGRLYEGRKVLMYCPRCETPLSKAEIAMDNSYKDVTDEAVFVKLKVKEGQKINGESIKDNTYILAWTTTPWTLPANVALAVGSDITYVQVKQGDEQLILAKERLEVLDEKVEVLEEVKGSDLVGLSYEPLYAVEKVKIAKSNTSWTVVTADFVTTEDGTGVVHIAPMYGEDDYTLGIQNKLPIVPLLDATGTYNADAPEMLRGMYYKKGGRYVTEDLEKRKLIFGKHPHLHSYPHCYRCGTALIYNALTSWFINIQSIKERMLEANEEVNWYPEHLKHGRFKHNLETAPDWTISRNRFWASPLPIWKHEKTGEISVIGSLKELREHAKKSGNKYLVVRHGQAESNVANIISPLPEDGTNHITEKGKEQAFAAAEKLKGEKITRIIVSPLLRTRETAECIAETIGYNKKDIQIEERFQEWQLGDLNGKQVSELSKACPTYEQRLTKGCGSGETLTDMKRRVGEALYELEEKYTNETILIVGHEYTAWFAECVAKGADTEKCIEIRGTNDDFIENAEVRELDFVPLPHNKKYELDLHRPYIDDLVLVASDGARLVRIPEVVDCWMESGSMPFASEHYPHENKELVQRRYPGDFIAEYIAQTRTWFYYMHALGVLLFDGPSFKNCVTTGNVLAADGAKMSKSKKNYTDPLVDMDKYGADAARFYLMGSVVMQAEDTAFKDEELREAHNRFVNMLWNSYQFYEMNAGTLATQNPELKIPSSKHVLDRWILVRLNGLVRECTTCMEAYDTVQSAKALREFVADLSQWYVRRSRDRFKSSDKEEQEAALSTTRYVLLTLSKLSAPITPYVAESIYRGVGGSEESVHLASWPEEAEGQADEKLLKDMIELRRIASLALEVRQKAGMKVRQPLAKLTLAHEQLKDKVGLIKVLLDEINVKEFFSNTKQEEEIVLDMTLTDELKKEGNMRELLRAVQALRKKDGLSQDEMVTLVVEVDDVGKELVTASMSDLEKTAGIKEVVYEAVEDGAKVKAGDIELLIRLRV